MSDLIELAKRRGYFFQSNEAYGGAAGFYTYGPQGASLKRNVEEAWRDRFVVREGNVKITREEVHAVCQQFDVGRRRRRRSRRRVSQRPSVRSPCRRS